MAEAQTFETGYGSPKNLVKLADNVRNLERDALARELIKIVYEGKPELQNETSFNGAVIALRERFFETYEKLATSFRSINENANSDSANNYIRVATQTDKIELKGRDSAFTILEKDKAAGLLLSAALSEASFKYRQGVYPEEASQLIER